MKACDHSVRKGLPAILLMAGLLAACGNEAADDVTDPMSGEETPTVLPAGEAIAGAKVATLDPATMVDAEIQTVLGGPPRCVFRYTSFGKPVLALGGGADGAPAAGHRLGRTHRHGRRSRPSHPVAQPRSGRRGSHPPLRDRPGHAGRLSRLFGLRLTVGKRLEFF